MQRVDNITHRFALGAFRTHPTPFLCHDTCSPPAHSRLDAKTDAAILRLLSLPDTNPAAKLTKAVFRRNRQSHLSTVHHRNRCRTLPGLPEVLDLDKAGIPPPPNAHGVIAPTPTEATAFATSNVDQPPPPPTPTSHSVMAPTSRRREQGQRPLCVTAQTKKPGRPSQSE